jgi:phosphatidylglycerol:prolipoprotein diacylglycerol transferase
MFNEIHIGPITLYMYGIMTAIGIISAYFFASHRAKKKGLDEDPILGLVIWCCIFGYLGSKLLYIITILPKVVADPSILLGSLRNGWVIYGGILGGILGGWLYCRRKKLPAWDYFDTGLEAVALAQGFGRIGCFFAGCCYGLPTEAGYGIVFRHSHYAPNNIALVPTQLMSSAFDFLLCLVLVFYDNNKKKRSGEPTLLYLMLYSVGRFIIEFMRGDLERGSVGTLSTSQFIALIVFTCALVVFIRHRRGAFENEAANDEAVSPEAEKQEEHPGSEE